MQCCSSFLFIYINNGLAYYWIISSYLFLEKNFFSVCSYNVLLYFIYIIINKFLIVSIYEKIVECCDNCKNKKNNKTNNSASQNNEETNNKLILVITLIIID